MMNLLLAVTIAVTVAGVVGTIGFVLTQCNCKLMQDNEVLVEAFFPWTFNKRVKKYEAQVEAKRRAERQAYEEARILKQQANKAKKLAILRTIELGIDIEQNAIIKRCNDRILEYVENIDIDVSYFEYLQNITIDVCYKALNDLMLRRQNHAKVVKFHCA